MDKLKYRNIILHLAETGKWPNEIFKELVETYGDASPSYSTVKYWARNFKHGVSEAGDAPRSGRPESAILQSTVDQIKKLVESDPKMSIRMLAARTNSSYGTTFTILHEHLNMKKLYAKWVPYNLSEAQKANRVCMARSFLRKFCTDFESTKARLITSDETWIMYTNPSNNENSRERHLVDSPRPQKPKLQPRGEKVMLTVWWDARGVIMLDFWKKSDKIPYDATYYQNLIEKVRKILPRVRRGIISARPLVLIDNAPIHSARDTGRCFEKNGFELAGMPPYSPDLAPSDYYLFRNLKSWLQGRCFESEEELISEVEAWFRSKPADFYERGIEQLRDRMKSLIKSGGEYLD